MRIRAHFKLENEVSSDMNYFWYSDKCDRSSSEDEDNGIEVDEENDIDRKSVV